ncbi:MAG TPA: NUDIX hydrolase [Flavobacteriales bacterium]|nr:NUDIX hydrolase [Flavobacteriales bacterium]
MSPAPHNPNISVDCVVFGFDQDELKVLLIEQTRGPKEKVVIQYALPGDLLFKNEGLDDAAERVLYDLASLKGIYLKQFHTFGDIDRLHAAKDQEWLQTFREDPKARVITVAYYSLVKMDEYEPQAASFAGKAEWVNIEEVPSLAFDHDAILSMGLERLREELETKNIGFELLPKKFTLSQLQRLYEIILVKKLDKRNFRKKLKNMSAIKPLNEKQKGVLHKPAQLFTYKDD